MIILGWLCIFIFVFWAVMAIGMVIVGSILTVLHKLFGGEA